MIRHSDRIVSERQRDVTVGSKLLNSADQAKPRQWCTRPARAEIELSNCSDTASVGIVLRTDEPADLSGDEGGSQRTQVGGFAVQKIPHFK